MKNFVKLTILLFVTVTVLQGCRKGENDPLISLRSRDARLTGEWKLVEYESTSSFAIQTYNGSIWTQSFEGQSFSYTYSRSLVIEKDGTFINSEFIDGEYEEERGRWSWLSDAKNKTRILLDGVGIYYIDQLKNSEMIFTDEYEDESSRAVFEKQ
jgi:hypothetical protein